MVPNNLSRGCGCCSSSWLIPVQVHIPLSSPVILTFSVKFRAVSAVQTAAPSTLCPLFVELILSSGKHEEEPLAMTCTAVSCVCYRVRRGDGEASRAATVMGTSILSPSVHALHVGISKTLLSNIALCAILLVGLMNGVSN